MSSRDIAKVAGLAERPFEASEQDSVTEHIRAGLDARLRSLISHDHGTRLGEDPEELHQMRVAVRRMRAMLKSGRSFLDPDWVRPLLDELRWLGQELGAVRDLDVLLDRLRQDVAELSDEERGSAATLIADVEADRANARREMLAALDSDRYLALISALGAATRRELPTRKSDVDQQAALIGLVDSQFRKLRKDAEALAAEPADTQLHALRIRGKRLRYTAELAVPLSGKGMRKLVEKTKTFQDVLGEHQDSCVAAQRLRRVLDDHADVGVAFVTGRLVERENTRRLDCRRQWMPAWKELHATARKAL